jgi:hypothetical protein
MRGGQIVSSPDGDRWQVKRRWTNRPLPDLKRRWRGEDGDRAISAGLETAGFGLDSSIVATIAAAVLVAVLVFVLWPLLGIAFELVLLFLLLTSGIVGRVFLRRPWIVEASNLDHPDRSATFGVTGWRRSGQAIEELARTIPATGLPAELSE